MKKLDNFSNSLEILKSADFELAWKALQEVLRIHGSVGADTGSPREILQLGYKYGFINDSAVWLLMLKKETVLFTYMMKMRLTK
jgi:hypothetical protein